MCTYQVLRSQFVFKVIPMLNPDGVIVGNYRTSLAGVDLNRVYKNTVPELFPTIFHTKAVIDSFMSERKVLFSGSVSVYSLYTTSQLYYSLICIHSFLHL